MPPSTIGSIETLFIALTFRKRKTQEKKRKIHNAIQLNKPKQLPSKTQQANPDLVASYDTRPGNDVATIYSTNPGHDTGLRLK